MPVLKPGLKPGGTSGAILPLLDTIHYRFASEVHILDLHRPGGLLTRGTIALHALFSPLLYNKFLSLWLLVELRLKSIGIRQRNEWSLTFMDLRLH